MTTAATDAAGQPRAKGELVRIEIVDAPGVFAARQLGRAVAAELALDHQDQVRVATALSEIGRDLVVSGQKAVIAFLVSDGELVVTVRHDGPSPADGLAAAARLMDQVEAAGHVVRLAKRRPPGARRPNLTATARRLAALVPSSPLDELRKQNEDLIAALGDLQEQKNQLLVLNAELEETNKGVMALYGQLSDELEQTNQGVVALYAELDEKSQRLRDALTAKDRFWANVSHELRSPLHSITGLAELLAGSPASPPGSEQRYQAELILGAAHTLLGLVNELLDVAKAESGQLAAEPAEVDLPALLSRLGALLRPMTQDRPVGVTVDNSAAPATILTDEKALTAILRNLLSNALKYTDNGEVTLRVQETGDRLEFTVTDTGIGIPAHHRGRVFEEFFQVPGVRRGGTGLGLPYARRLAELLGGELSLASEPGQGTTATVILPHRTPRVGSVLVADDDAAYRQVLRGLLDGIAGQVTEVTDGERALATLSGGGVDLVLTDLRMPQSDGYALLASMPAGMPAIVITALDVSEPPAGARALLRKDELTRERLAYTIRQILREGR
ncbi:MAG TPA: ATP-binding protein [Streptosporangiaceae bacterium]|jgi:signal transduction histidine kinase